MQQADARTAELIIGNLYIKRVTVQAKNVSIITGSIPKGIESHHLHKSPPGHRIGVIVIS